MGRKTKKNRQSTNNNDGERPRSSTSPALQPSSNNKNRSSSSQESLISLAARLKRERGTADTTPLPPEYIGTSSKTFLSPSDGTEFTECWKTSYHNFCWQEPHALDTSLHADFDSCFEHLEGLYLYDAVQAGGKKVTHTFVKRTLIGEPGSTYRYLGLRLFSHPWIACDGDSVGGSPTTCSDHDQEKMIISYGYSQQHARALLQMGRLNESLIQKTQQQLDLLPQDKLLGSCKYTLTLVNRMEPSSIKKDLKRDPILQNKTSVSWHKDSGLQDFSSIAVYHSLKQGEKPHTKPWRVALRVASSEHKTPALVVPMASGALYYLLDDCNHQHEHAVLSGATQIRYSSTHRVARGQTWQSVHTKCESILRKQQSRVNSDSIPTVKDVRAQQQLWTELEFEWIRQWYIQGRAHADLHPYWHKPLKYMEASWKTLYEKTKAIVQQLASGKGGDEDIYDVLIEAYQERLLLREKWEDRLRDAVYKTSPPIECTTTEPLEQLKETIATLRKLKKKKFAASGKTKKEKRKAPSNWQALQKTTKKSQK